MHFHACLLERLPQVTAVTDSSRVLYSKPPPQAFVTLTKSRVFCSERLPQGPVLTAAGRVFYSERVPQVSVNPAASKLRLQPTTVSANLIQLVPLLHCRSPACFILTFDAVSYCRTIDHAKMRTHILPIPRVYVSLTYFALLFD